MKRLRLLLILAGLLCAACAGPATAVAQEADGAADTDARPVLRLAAAVEAPFVEGPGAEERPGYAVERVDRAAAGAGLRTSWRFLPWPLAVRGVREGRFDAVVGAPASLADGLETAPLPLWRSDLVLFGAADNDASIGPGAAEPADRRIGCIAGMPPAGSLAGMPDASPDGDAPGVLHARGYAPVESLLRWIAAGEVDRIAAPPAAVTATRTRIALESLRLAPAERIDWTVERVIAFAPGTAEKRLDALRTRLAEMSGSPADAALAQAYGLAEADAESTEAADVRADRLVVLAEAYPPAILETPEGPGGFVIEIVRRVIERAHDGTIPPAAPLRVVEWTEGYNRAQGREWVALLPTARTPEREDRFRWVGPLFHETVGLYALAGNDIRIHVLEDARWVDRIGTVSDDYKEQILEERQFTNLLSARKQWAHARNLTEGWIDLWMTSDIGMAWQARKAGVDPARIRRIYNVRKAPTYIAFSLATPPEIVEAWRAALDAMRAAGQFRAILERHGVADSNATPTGLPTEDDGE